MTLEDLVKWLDSTPSGEHCRTATIEVNVHQGPRVAIDLEEYWIDDKDRLVERYATGAEAPTLRAALKLLKKPRRKKPATVV